MAGEYRPRPHPWINPERMTAVLRRLVAALDGNDADEFSVALTEARRLLNPPTPPRASGDE
jgi:hypothetical protein